MASAVRRPELSESENRNKAPRTGDVRHETLRDLLSRMSQSGLYIQTATMATLLTYTLLDPDTFDEWAVSQITSREARPHWESAFKVAGLGPEMLDVLISAIAADRASGQRVSEHFFAKNRASAYLVWEAIAVMNNSAPSAETAAFLASAARLDVRDRYVVRRDTKLNQTAFGNSLGATSTAGRASAEAANAELGLGAVLPNGFADAYDLPEPSSRAYNPSALAPRRLPREAAENESTEDEATEDEAIDEEATEDEASSGESTQDE